MNRSLTSERCHQHQPSLTSEVWFYITRYHALHIICKLKMYGKRVDALNVKIPSVQVQRIKYLYSSILYCMLLDDAFITCKKLHDRCIFFKLRKAGLNLAYPKQAFSGRFLDLLWCSIRSHSNCLVNTGIKSVWHFLKLWNF